MYQKYKRTIKICQVPLIILNLKMNQKKVYKIKVARIACAGEMRQGRLHHETIELSSNDPIFKMKANCPIGERVGLPLVVKKLDRFSSQEKADYDCQWATYIQIDTKTGGFAPYDWQNYVGSVLVCRPGGKHDFTSEDQEIFHDFCDRLLSQYGEEDEGDCVKPDRDVIPSKFIENALNYIRNMSDYCNVGNVTTIDRQNEKVSWEQILFEEEGRLLEEFNPLETPFCFSCGAHKDVKLKKCGGCLVVSYCKTECQQKDWSSKHKKVCKDLKNDVINKESYICEKAKELSLILSGY